jgi:hypothetical protein
MATKGTFSRREELKWTMKVAPILETIRLANTHLAWVPGRYYRRYIRRTAYRPMALLA